MQEDVTTSSIDLKRMVLEAQAAGFNPLTVMRAGLGAGFATQRTQYGVVAGGSFTADPPASSLNPGGGFLPTGEFYQPAPGHALDHRGASQSMREGFDGGDQPDTYQGWGSESELNIAVHQLRMRMQGTGNVVTDDGVVIRTNYAANQGGMFNPITATAPSGQGGDVVRPRASPKPGTSKPGQSVGDPAVMTQFQEEQLYQPDKLPAVVKQSVYWPLIPGVDWLVTGGKTPGETWQTFYADEGPGSLMSVPGFMYDLGINQQRLFDTFTPKPADDASWWPKIYITPDP